jgi:N utilization substance protein B
MSEPGDEPTGPPSVRPVEGGRHAARERALHLLYEAAMKHSSPTDVLDAQVLAADPYAELLVRGVGDHTGEVDALIEELAPEGWPLSRMAVVDLNLLRLGCYELAHRPDVPTGVVLAEAVGLAERYGTDDSPRFVNGLLAAAASRLRSEQ